MKARPVDFERAQPSLDVLECLRERCIKGCIGPHHEAALLQSMRKGEVRPANDDKRNAGKKDTATDEDQHDSAPPVAPVGYDATAPWRVGIQPHGSMIAPGKGGLGIRCGDWVVLGSCSKGSPLQGEIVELNNVSIRPVLAVSGGRLIAPSMSCGTRGWCRPTSEGLIGRRVTPSAFADGFDDDGGGSPFFLPASHHAHRHHDRVECQVLAGVLRFEQCLEGTQVGA